MLRLSRTICFVAASCCLGHVVVAQRKAQTYALGTFSVNASAFIPVPARIGDSLYCAVLMNDALHWVLKKHKAFMPFGYRRYVRSHIRRNVPIAFSVQEFKDEVTSLAPRDLVERYHALDYDSLLTASFDVRGLLIPDEEGPEGAAVIAVLFARGSIVSMDDESGVAYLDTGWETKHIKDTHRTE